MLEHADVQEVATEPIGRWGNVTRWRRPGGADIVWAEAAVGGHNNASRSSSFSLMRRVADDGVRVQIGTTEVSARLIRDMIYGARREKGAVVGGWEDLDTA